MTASLILGCILLTAAAQAQSALPPSEPSFLNTFYALSSNGQLIELEHETATIHSKTRALPGYASVKLLAEIEPGRSPVRLLSGTQFIVRGRAPIDPSTRFDLRYVKASKKHREFLTTRAHATLLNAQGSSGLEEGSVPIRFEQYGQYSYRIAPDHPLSPGEYALSLRGLIDLYCFGVDR